MHRYHLRLMTTYADALTVADVAPRALFGLKHRVRTDHALEHKQGLYAYVGSAQWHADVDDQMSQWNRQGELEMIISDAAEQLYIELPPSGARKPDGTRQSALDLMGHLDWGSDEMWHIRNFIKLTMNYQCSSKKWSRFGRPFTLCPVNIATIVGQPSGKCPFDAFGLDFCIGLMDYMHVTVLPELAALSKTHGLCSEHGRVDGTAHIDAYVRKRLSGTKTFLALMDTHDVTYQGLAMVTHPYDTMLIHRTTEFLDIADCVHMCHVNWEILQRVRRLDAFLVSKHARGGGIRCMRTVAAYNRFIGSVVALRDTGIEAHVPVDFFMLFLIPAMMDHDPSAAMRIFDLVTNTNVSAAMRMFDFVPNVNI